MNQTINTRIQIRFLTSTLIISAVALGLSACSGNNTRPTTEKNNIQASRQISLSYEVQRGDSLGLIAKRITGNSDNWAEIASVNGVNDPKSLQVGMLLLIPEYLIPEMASTQSVEPLPIEPTDSEFDEQREIEATTENVALLEAEAQPASTFVDTRRDKKDWVFQASSLPGVLTAPVTVHQADANRTFEVERASVVDAPVSEKVSEAPSPQKPTQNVRVIGTYYPKGIYTQPSYTSKLLMRVAPGTQMELEKSLGEWLQIRTEKGSGYIRTIDAEILGAANNNEMLLSNNG